MCEHGLLRLFSHSQAGRLHSLPALLFGVPFRTMPTYRTIISYRGAEQVAAHFLIADSLANLSAASPVDVGVFFPGDLSQDMDVDAGTFAADELELVVDGVAADTTDDTAAIAFAIDAAESLNDPTKKRFVGVLLNPATPPVVGDWAFRGVLLPEITADDVNWNDGEFGVAPAPLRTYKLRAMSADIVDVLGAKLTELVEEINDQGSWKSAHVQDRLGWFYSDGSSDEFGPREGRYGNLVAWNDLANHLVYLAGLPYGLTASFESDLSDLDAAPVHFKSAEKFGRHTRYGIAIYNLYSTNIEGNIFNGPRYRLNPGGSIDDDGALFVDWKLLEPDSENASVAWLRYETVGDLLHAVAMSIGMVVSIAYTTSTNVVIRFVARSNVQTKPNVYLPDVEKGSINSKPIQSSRKQFRGQAWNLSPEGLNIPYWYEGGTFRGDDDWPVRVSGELLALSISAPLCILQGTGEDADLESDDFLPPWLILPHNGLFYDSGNPKSTSVEHNRRAVHTGMYIAFTQGTSPAYGTYGCENKRVVRPVGQVTASIDGSNEYFLQLAEFCNALYDRDSVYYESEYELDVPYISRFRATPAGAEHWANVGLGFTTTLDGLEYTVVGITRNFGDGTTKLRLHNASRYSGVAAAISPTPPPVAQIALPAAPPPYERRGRTTVMLKAGEDMPDDWTVVALRDDDLLYIAEPIEQEYERTVGVVIGARQAGDMCEVQLRGRVKLPVELSAAVGSRVYLRSESLMDTNISIHPLKQRTTTEQLHLNLGYLESPNTLFLEMSEEWILQ